MFCCINRAPSAYEIHRKKAAVRIPSASTSWPPQIMSLCPWNNRSAGQFMKQYRGWTVMYTVWMSSSARAGGGSGGKTIGVRRAFGG